MSNAITLRNAAIACFLAFTVATAAVRVHRHQSLDYSGYMARVEAQIKAMPRYLPMPDGGSWVGEVLADPTPEAVELLAPNHIEQRRYRRLSGSEGFELLIVHCGNAKDMQGHWPPNCYPAHGWRMYLDPGEIEVEVAGRMVTAADYVFIKADPAGVERRMRVINLFATPSDEGGTIGGNIRQVNRAGASRTWRQAGACQVQVIFPGTPSDEAMQRGIAAAMSLVGPVLESVMHVEDDAAVLAGADAVDRTQRIGGTP